MDQQICVKASRQFKHEITCISISLLPPAAFSFDLWRYEVGTDTPAAL